MRVDTVERISRWLEQSGGLFEALLTELRLVNHGYSVRVEFSVVVDRAGHVLDDPLDVGFDLDGVRRLTLEGGLTSAMLEHPERINWGLSEVSQVRVASCDDGIRFEARWEGGERRVEVDCRRATLTAPEELP